MPVLPVTVTGLPTVAAVTLMKMPLPPWTSTFWIVSPPVVMVKLPVAVSVVSLLLAELRSANSPLPLGRPFSFTVTSVTLSVGVESGWSVTLTVRCTASPSASVIV